MENFGIISDGSLSRQDPFEEINIVLIVDARVVDGDRGFDGKAKEAEKHKMPFMVGGSREGRQSMSHNILKMIFKLNH
jgi:hypothetical protein